MTFQKGKPRTGGRQPGTPNKITASIRETFEKVFNDMQKRDDVSLGAWAQDHPTDFYKLTSKLLPVDMAIQGGIVLNVVTGLPVLEQLEDQAVDDGSDLA